MVHGGEPIDQQISKRSVQAGVGDNRKMSIRGNF
jgi:hypothetical protein